MGKRWKWLRYLAAAGMIFAVLLLLYACFVTIMPDLWPVLKSGDEATIEAYLRSENRFMGMLCMALLQFIQVVSIVLPGAPIQIAGGIVYGTWRGFVLCHLSFVAANILVFYASRKVGNGLEQLFPGTQKSDAKLTLFLNSSDPALMTAIACLMPGIPNGIIPYAASRTKLSLRRFAASVYLASLLPILVMCAIGGRILSGDYLLAVVMLAGLFLFILLLYCNRGRLLQARDWLHAKLARYRCVKK